MSEADKMFEELGFKNFSEYDTYKEISYYKKDRQWREDGELQVNFNINMKNIDIAFKETPIFLQPEEIKVLYQKCKELGWLDE